MDLKQSRFTVGQMVHHKLFDYRGVIVDIDPVFNSSEEWYETMAKSNPPKDKPWYIILVHDGIHTTYVAEQNLEPDLTGEEIHHPDLPHYFDKLENGLYRKSNRDATGSTHQLH